MGYEMGQDTQVTFDPALALWIDVLIFGFVAISGLPLVFNRTAWPHLRKPLLILLLSLLVELAFVTSATFGLVTLGYSLMFFMVGGPLSILAINLTLRQRTGVAKVGMVVSSGLCLLMWLFLITLH